MPHMNICILAGHLTRDVELRYTPSGTPVGEFGLGINRKWKSESGEMKEEVSFFDCVCFGKTAENIAQYFGKGGAIMIEGRLKQETWEDKQTGKNRSKVKVIIERFHFVGKSGKSEDGGERSERPARRGAPPPATGEAPPPDDGDDVPF